MSPGVVERRAAVSIILATALPVAYGESAENPVNVKRLARIGNLIATASARAALRPDVTMWTSLELNPRAWWRCLPCRIQAVYGHVAPYLPSAFREVRNTISSAWCMACRGRCWRCVVPAHSVRYLATVGLGLHLSLTDYRSIGKRFEAIVVPRAMACPWSQ